MNRVSLTCGEDVVSSAFLAVLMCIPVYLVGG